MVKRSGTPVLIALTLALAAPAYWLLFSTLMAHDDEGYVLISLKNYVLHGELYTRLFSQYGPFFYFFHDIAHRLLHYEFTNTTARLTTLGCWLFASFACAQLVWRQTRNPGFSATTLLASFSYLQLMMSEPGHPGGLISALIAATVLAGVAFIERSSVLGLAIIASLSAAALMLIKINVGVFFGLSACVWFVLHLRHPVHSRLSSGALAVVLCILPFALMKGEWHESWVQQFAALSVVASTTMLMIGWTIRHPLSEWKLALYGSISAASLMIVVTIAVVLRGTSLTSLWEGVVVNPLRQPGIYHFAPDWKPAASLSAILSLTAALFYVLKPNRFPNELIFCIRLLATFFLGLAACHWFPFSFHSSVMSYVVPWAWILVIPLTKDEPRTASCVRLWIGLVLTLQYLHAYPVAGSQVAWGTFLAIPLAALALHDAWRFWLARTMTGLVQATLTVTAAFFALGAIQLGIRGWSQYRDSPALALYGAENLRPPRAFGSALRVLSSNARVHGDMLFSLPGMFSFNQWTGLPTPSLNNTTHWFTLLKESQQNEIADALAKDNRPVVIVHQGMLKFLADGHFSIASPLSDFLSRNFVRSFKVDDYEFWVRRGREIIPINAARYLPVAISDSGRRSNKLELVVELPPEASVSRIELVTLADTPTTLTQWDHVNAEFQSTEISIDVKPAPIEVSLAQRPKLVRLTVVSQDAMVPDPRYCMVFIKNAAGEKIGEARFVE